MQIIKSFIRGFWYKYETEYLRNFVINDSLHNDISKSYYESYAKNEKQKKK